MRGRPIARSRFVKQPMDSPEQRAIIRRNCRYAIVERGMLVSQVAADFGITESEVREYAGLPPVGERPREEVSEAGVPQ